MRTKILRALAHVKAAKLHLAAARGILTGYQVSAPLVVVNAVNGAIASAAGLGVEAGAFYARAVVDELKPAELPE